MRTMKRKRRIKQMFCLCAWHRHADTCRAALSFPFKSQFSSLVQGRQRVYAAVCMISITCENSLEKTRSGWMVRGDCETAKREEGEEGENK